MCHPLVVICLLLLVYRDPLNRRPPSRHPRALQYMGLLLKKSRRREMNKEVERAFWKEHRASHLRVRRWRKPDLDPRSVWKLLPTLIVWRK